MIDYNPTQYHIHAKKHLKKDEGDKRVDATLYMSLVGGLCYLVHTRPDVTFAAGMLSRYMETSTVLHLNAVKKIFCYIRGTHELGLVFPKESGNNILKGFSYTNLAGHV